MRFLKKHINYLALFLCLIALFGLFLFADYADTEVVFTDPGLEAAIRERLEVPAKPIHTSQLSKITELDASNRGITTLDDIVYLSNLTVLNLQGNNIQDLSPLASLRKLKKLNLSNNSLIDLQSANFAALADMPLEQLDLSYNVVVRITGERIRLTDISLLGEFTSLKELNLIDNGIQDISALSSLTNLRTLWLDNNPVQDIAALQGAKSLKLLSLANNEVIDLSPLAESEQLIHLYLHGNETIQSVAPLENLSQLKTLTLDYVPVGDEIDALGDKPHLQLLSLNDAHITDIAPLKSLSRLEELHLANNDIVDISPLSGLSNLEELGLQANRNIVSIRPLAGLDRLDKLDLQDVPVGDEINLLSQLDHLKFLDARNCGISDISLLGDLMAKGALQDNPDLAITATVDIRDNPLDLTSVDAYAPVRAYWNNITTRLPYLLPEYTPLAAPVFSAVGGYYSQPFELTLSTNLDNVSIYYTLDGSEPTSSSLLYTGPIPVKTRIGEPNLYSMIEDVSPRWQAPEGEVFKVNVVRARVISLDGQSSPIITHTYLVDEEKRYSLPVISITTQPDYLFDYQNGLYMMGPIYAAAYNPDSGLNTWEFPANYTQRGAAWERPAHIEYFDANGKPGFSQNITMRIHGAMSRERAQKSLRIYADCVQGCNGVVAYELFPGLTSTATGQPIQQFTTFLMRNSGNDWERTMFRDALIQKLVEHTRLDIQAYQSAVVFINGEYWGIHNLRERLDEYYIENHYGIPAEEVVMLSDNALLSVGTPGDEQAYLNLLDFVKTQDMTDPENYAFIQTQMDVENYIDYQILEIYSDNNNWPHVNVEYWRKKTSAYEPNAPYGQDGRWRWMVFDTDFGFGLNNGMEAVNSNNLINAISPNWHEDAGTLFRSLLQNPDFKASFLRRFADHLNTSFEPGRVASEIDQMQAVIAPEIAEHIARWQGETGSLDNWQADVDLLRYFAENRPAAMRQQLIDYFALDGTANLHLMSTPDMGYVRVNTVDIVAGTPGVPNPGDWSGVYFTDMPVELTAIPLPGYRFEKWVNASGEEFFTEELVVTLDGDAAYTAVFVEE